MSYTQEIIDQVCQLKADGVNHRDISQAVFGKRSSASSIHTILEKYYYKTKPEARKLSVKDGDGPKILVFDIETAPCMSYHWGLWQQNIGLSMTVKDWYVLSWAAKWVGDDHVMYEDKRDDPMSEDDSTLIEGIWKLLDEADIIVTQNGKKFDVKKLHARFLMAGMQPPSSYKHIDTLVIAKRHFAFTSNKLEYMTDKLCKKFKKLNHGKFAGFLLWQQCLAGNPEAWDEMEEYNKYDVLSLEELMFILAPWSNQLPNLDMYFDDLDNHCMCGSTDFEPNGYYYTQASKFVKLKCSGCGAEKRTKVNLLSKEKRATFIMNVPA